MHALAAPRSRLTGALGHHQTARLHHRLSSGWGLDGPGCLSRQGQKAKRARRPSIHTGHRQWLLSSWQGRARRVALMTSENKHETNGDDRRPTAAPGQMPRLKPSLSAPAVALHWQLTGDATWGATPPSPRCYQLVWCAWASRDMYKRKAIIKWILYDEHGKHHDIGAYHLRTT
jgi:hypothetical protein